jgi:hypothetical protein
MIRNLTMLSLLLVNIVLLVACGNDKALNKAIEVERYKHPEEIVLRTFDNISAIYIGQLDIETIEVSIDGKRSTFTMKDKTGFDANAFSKDDKIIISYKDTSEKVKDGEIKRRFLTNIKKIVQ